MLIYMQESTSFLSSLRYCNEIANLLLWVIWACLATQTYNNSMNLKKPFIFIFRQKINFILNVFLEILQSCWFGYFGHAWLCTPKSNTINLQKTFLLIYRQKINFIFHIFMEILQRNLNFLFRVPWVCLAMHTKIIVSHFRKLRCLSAFTSSLRYYILKNPPI